MLLIAVPLINIAFGPMTASLLSDGNFPICAQLAELYPDEPSCFKINVVPSSGYNFTIAVVLIFCVCGFDGSPTHKYVHRKLFPGDNPPPTCPSWRRRRAALPAPQPGTWVPPTHVPPGELQDI